jgi:hypothetical protein
MKITTGGRKNKIATQQEKLEHNPTTAASVTTQEFRCVNFAKI